jgi:transcriptional regulator with XRE-family HTH domain
MKVGEKIKKIRELKNYTQHYMANQLDLSISGYGKIERDETDLSLGKLEKIATVLGVDINKILSFDEKQIFNFDNSHNAMVSMGNQHINGLELIEKFANQYQEENKYLKALVKELMEKLANK